jgi:hypothetical protein
MKKIFLLSLSLMLACFCAFAGQISENEAMLKAASFGKKAVSSRLMDISRSSETLSLAYTQPSATAPADNCFYVFNRGENDGYIIVAADDRAESILGYSDSGKFDYANMPENARWWLSEYQREIQHLIDHPDLLGGIALPKTLTTNVSPLCRSLWNQDSPFNDNCPTYTDTTNNTTVHCATGCAATSMAQVMYYYKWPATGTGSNSYTSKTSYGSRTLTYNLSADFSKSTYDWANMVDAYNSSATTTQRAAVAKLMSDAGISISMNYGESSGAAQFMAAKALATNFGYDKSIMYSQRDYYAISEWESMIRTELDSHRPVIYEGTGDGGGHSFVCDGYNTDGYFHFNWGWGGMSNGYFLTSSLTPSSQGIGGNSDGFNSKQGIVTRIMKATTGTDYNYSIYVDSISPINTTVALGSTLTVNATGIWNLGWNNFSGNIGFITYDSAGKSVATQKALNVTFNSYRGFGYTQALKYTVPSNLSAGNYRVYIGELPTSASSWQLARCAVGQAQCLNVVVSGSSAKVTTDLIGSNLTTTSIAMTSNPTYNNVCSFNAEFHNSGAEYSGPIYMALFNSSGSCVQLISNHLDIPSGTSATSEYSLVINAPAGTAYIQFLDKNYKVISQSQITVGAYSAPALSLTNTISFPDNNNVPQDNMQLTATIKNTGGTFGGKIFAFIFPVTGGSSIGYLTGSPVIESNTTKTVTLTGGFGSGVPGTKYMIALYYLNASNQYAAFTPGANYKINFILKGSSGVNSIGTSANRIFPNPATDAVTIENMNPIKSVEVYSSTGALALSQKSDNERSITLNVASLPTGSYIVRVATEAGTTVQRFIKK